MSYRKHKSMFQESANPGLSVYECGWEKCGRARPAAAVSYPHYIMRFVVSGEGECLSDGREYKLSAGEMLLIRPGTNVLCRPHDDNPWVYFWVGFNGPEAAEALDAAGFGEGRQALKVVDRAKVERIMRGISQYSERGEAGRYGMTGWLYLLFSELISGAGKPAASKTRGENYVSMAMEYIDSRFSQDIGIDGIAFHIGIERSYFYKVFKETIGLSPQEYLIKVRMSHAEALLADPAKTLKEIAVECGYPNYSNFSKMFKSKSGLSPKSFRRKSLGK